MPKSKRDKRVSLTQTRKKGLELKQKLIEDIRENVDRYARIFLFSVHNMRNTHLKDVRQDWKHSRFYFGKNKVMSLALGRTHTDEYRDNLHEISKNLKGQTGLLFTNKTKDDVIEYFKNFRVSDYARAGAVATQTVILEEGPLPEFSHSMEPQLRQLGLPTSLKKGVITLNKEYTVCNLDQTLTPEQARILKLFGHEMAEFHVTVESVWSNNGTFQTIESGSETISPTKVKVRPKKKAEEEEVSDTEMIDDDDDESDDESDDDENDE
ncbi:mRNA turnover protein 4 homolog isoform X2 [Mercenaria mercenaria]|uniref:mRNA turnover protein 4 homolog isoform X2 n=1 Tax=Mercenaria mercenaria TaxID=6596 RepID=UPI00234E7B8F|nr:mRNA turnover protein 4 homolog isoform X2 [Mercenaria mercenaria]